ncbi:uncharacterized protein LOC128724608 [Anopheles nili]|uniref:uncharacterized protein LOC128724608 n=1 Tax=Anopheles nili TaxID=185578 RepID=UPI00237B89E9|nr:uncharacterized protein LOC128724608 [Anopheles nili]
MAFPGSLILLLVGFVCLCGVVLAGETSFDDVNSLPPDEKRRIIRELLRAQKDIRGALLKIQYSLNGEVFEGDDNDELYSQGCWDKNLAGFRKSFRGTVTSLTDGMKRAHQMLDEMNERIRPGYPPKPGPGGEYGPPAPPSYGPSESGPPPPSYGPAESGPPSYGPPPNGPPSYGPPPGGPPSYGPPDSGPPSYGPPPPPGPPKPEYETSSESYVSPDDDDDDYDYVRRRPFSNRRYARELEGDEQTISVAPEREGKASNWNDEPEEDVQLEEALGQLADDEQ